jgi:hypothetical protein
MKRLQFGLLSLFALMTAVALFLGFRAWVDSPNARLWEALERPTDLDVVETPLEDVMVSLVQQHQIAIQFHREALDDNDSPAVTYSAKGVPLRDVLNAILKPQNLDYRVEEGLITIVPRQDASPTP